MLQNPAVADYLKSKDADVRHGMRAEGRNPLTPAPPSEAHLEAVSNFPSLWAQQPGYYS